ncbi:Tetratricopeptide-like helical [Artemisia annua]|uniref:Tetratricopeptide-like helical n=1 Tax=Artemisia annua TaxID=35608 RepID=A0A2U1PHT9_ARTAN|nr:Tetratricopeptide-like helical [Artemisia annua]
MGNDGAKRKRPGVEWYEMIWLQGNRRAVAYIQTSKYAEAILDCKKSIAINPNYIKAYIHLGYIYFILGIDAALGKGYGIATHLDPTNESVRENVWVADHKVWQQ